MATKTRQSRSKSKPNMIVGAQLALRKTLESLENERAKTDKQIRLVRSALAAIGIQNPRLTSRAKRKPMTAAERKSVSKRMKAYWAKKRAQKAS